MRRLREWLIRVLGGTPDPTLADLCEQIAGMQRQVTQVHLEWAETLDFIQRWSSRQGKRAQVDAKRALSEEPPAEEVRTPALVGDHRSRKAQLRQMAAARAQRVAVGGAE